jgi:glycosyltransferase involved in cell wall biosynthesis
MKKFKVLISTYHGAFLNPGGGEIELLKISKSLESSGLEVDIYGAGSKALDVYDAVLHFGVNADGLDFVRSVKASNKKLILWPNLWWHDNQNQYNATSANIFFELADRIIFKSYAEQSNNRKLCDVNITKSIIIPAGVEERFFVRDKILADNFKRLYNLNSYLLWIGVIQKQKNQLELIKSMYKSDFPIVFIGNGIDKDYYLECINLSENNIFIPNISYDSDLLLGAISGCSMYVELTDEPAGLSALEVGASGKKMLLLQSDWVQEHFGGYAITTPAANNHNLIKDTIEQNLLKSFDGATLANLIKQKHSMNKITKSLVSALES